jgi:anti-sigma factor RsiW
MIKTSTHNDLIQYIYDELALGEKTVFEKTLAKDHELAEHCAELLILQEKLNGELKAPSEKTINSILTYAKNLSLQQ